MQPTIIITKVHQSNLDLRINDDALQMSTESLVDLLLDAAKLLESQAMLIEQSEFTLIG